MVIYETDDSSTHSTVTVREPPSDKQNDSKNDDIQVKQLVALKKIDTKINKPQKKTLSVRFDSRQNKVVAIRKSTHMSERQKRRTWYQRSEMQRIKLDLKDHIRILKAQPHLIDSNQNIDQSTGTCTLAAGSSAPGSLEKQKVCSSSSLICIRGLEAEVFSDTIGKQRETIRNLSRMVVFGLQQQRLQQLQQQRQGGSSSYKTANHGIASAAAHSLRIAEEYKRITAASQEIAIRMGLLDQVMR